MSAVVLFVLLACVARFCASKTLDYLPLNKQQKYKTSYKWLGIAMFLFPIGGYAAALILRDMSTVVFWVEAAGICTFGIYWLVKSRELALSGLEKNPEAAVQTKRLNLSPIASDKDAG